MTHSVMSIQAFKQQNPELYQAIYNLGVRAEKNRAYVERRREEIRQAIHLYSAAQRDYCPF